MSSLGNIHHGTDPHGFEVVDVIFGKTSVFRKNQCPTIPSLCDFVMRAGYPRETEVKRVEQRDTGVYRLYIIRDPCPVILLPSQEVCPICRKPH